MVFRVLSILVVVSMWVCLSSAQFPNTEYGNPSGSGRFDQDFSSIGRPRSPFGHSSPFSNSRSRSFDSSGRFSSNNFGQFGSKNNFDFERQQQQQFPEFPLNNNNNEDFPSTQGQVQKFISVHIAPQEEPSTKSSNNRLQGNNQKPEKHYQIVFIKAPSTTNSDIEELELPPAPETKTLVYVLLKKPSVSDILKVRGQPANAKPTPPEVFFIRYKGKNQTEGNNGENNKKSGGGYDNSDNFENDEEDNEYGVGGGSGSHFK